MASNLYVFADIHRCRNQGHRFRLLWSDKNPERFNLMCVTCTLSTGKGTYVAYGKGVEAMGFGAWTVRRKKEESEDLK